MPAVAGLWVLASALSTAAAQQNLLANPSFEVLADGRAEAWTCASPSAVQFPAKGGHAGEVFAQITDPDAGTGISLESAPLPSRPGGRYTARAWFRIPDTCQPGIYLNFYDDLGIRVHHLYTRLPGPTDGWAANEVTAVAPPEAVTVSVTLYAYVGDAGTFDVDDVTLTVEGGGEPGSTGIARAEPGDKTMIEIGSRRELFVDSHLVDSLTGEARRLLHHPIPREIVLRFDRPWEGEHCGYVSAVNDGKVRLYYRGWAELEGRDCTCVAESEDGIHFTRPSVGDFEWDGSRDNNIIWMGEGCHNFTPFLDTNPSAPADQRYKALASAGPDASLVPFASPDGLHWRRLQEDPVITEGAFDSQNLAFWDPLRGEYVEYHRGFKDGVRDIMVGTSPDFLNWTKPVWLDYGDAPPEHLYTNAITPYLRAPHIYLGFPCRFVPSRKKVPTHDEDGINDGVLISSRDGLHFERWIEAFLRPAPDEKAWTDRNNYIAWGLAQTSPEEISLYWSEHYRYPDYYLRRGTIRTDGFVSVHAAAQGGEVLTRPLVFSGRRLVVNYETSAIGSLRFELCDEAGEPYAGFALAESEMLFGNEIEHQVVWQAGSDVSALAGKPVRLRVRMKDADLFSFRFAEG
jgi:hypothetical protein